MDPIQVLRILNCAIPLLKRALLFAKTHPQPQPGGELAGPATSATNCEPNVMGITHVRIVLVQFSHQRTVSICPLVELTVPRVRTQL